MTAITIDKHFDVLNFVKKAKESGIKEEFAEYQAREIEILAEYQAKEIAKLADKIQVQNAKISSLEAREPATRGDLEIVKLELQKEIEVIRREIEIVKKELGKEIKSSKIWTLLIFGGGWVSMLAIVAKGFHWW